MQLKILSLSIFLLNASILLAIEPMTVDLWPGKPPGEAKELPSEADQTTPDSKLVAGQRVIRLANVSTPQITIFRPAKEKNTGCAVVICPGGGHRVLAYDLEGTDAAQWLNTLGITGIVLKYRVPAREETKRWRAAVQDAQRAMSVVRSRAADWEIDPEKIGILGFSAGGETAARTALMTERTYEAVDEADKTSLRPNFLVLIYPAYLANKQGTSLRDDIRVTKDAPPAFLVHANDDHLTPLSSALLYTELKRAGVSAELHIYSAGGHGYGLRPQVEFPVTTWTERCKTWLQQQGLAKK